MQHAHTAVVNITSPRHLLRRENLLRLIEALREEEYLLAIAAKTQKSHLSAMKKGTRGVGDDLAGRFDSIGVDRLGLEPGWFDRKPQVDHDVSHELLSIPPKIRAVPVLIWRESKMPSQPEPTPLPDLFRVPAPDDAMADRVHKGWLLEFDRSLRPRQNDGVLLKDATGRWLFRLYSEGINGHFEARALHRDYLSFDSELHGLTVLAVLVGVPSRWG